jgi:hypothetical protein
MRAVAPVLVRLEQASQWHEVEKTMMATANYHLG